MLVVSEKKTVYLIPLIVLVLGVMGVSSGAIFARMAEAHPLAKSAWRVGIATAVVLPVALAFYRDEYKKLTRRDVGIVVLSGLFLAIHFGTWIASLDYTTVASSVILVNTAPIWVALINLALGRGWPSRRMWFCISLSVVGAGIVGYGDLSFDARALYGDFLAICGAVAVSGYILCGAVVRQKLSVTPYVAACYGAAAIFLWAAVLALGVEFSGFSMPTWGAFVGMALLAQVLGHSCYNFALGYFSTGFVSIMLLGEPIGSAILAYFLFDETPTPIKCVGIGVLIVSIVLSARSEK